MSYTTTSDTTNYIPSDLVGTAINGCWNQPTYITNNSSIVQKDMKNFDFGKVTDVKMSMYGPAFKSADSKWIALDKKTGDWTDVSKFLFNVDVPFYQVPVATEKILTGDFIRHNDVWVKVVDFDEATAYPIVEDIYNKEIKTIIPTKSPFGFDFYTKLINPIDNMDFDVSKEQPFGNMMPFLLMKNSNDILPLILLMKNNKLDMSDPMTIMALCGNKDMLPLMLMMNKDE